MKKRTRKLILTRNALANNRDKTAVSVLRADPTRTSMARGQFCRMLERQFDKLKAEVIKAIGTEDWLGVGIVENSNNLCPRCGKASKDGLWQCDCWDNKTVHNLYQPFVCNGQLGWFPFNAEQGLIEVPDVRQPDHYSCGAAASMSVGKWFGVGPDTVQQWKVKLWTDVEESTHPKSIVECLRGLGLQVEAFQHGNLQTLQDYLEEGRPVIVCVQDYGPAVPGRARFAYGHYLVVIGRDMGYVFCQDPSEDNVIAGGDAKSLDRIGSVQKPGRIMIAEEDFLSIWHDKDAEGNPFVRFGIAVGPRVVANCQQDQMRGADGRCGPGIGLSIERKDMPQIRKDDMPELFKFCEANTVDVFRDTAAASELKPTQGEFRQERVDALPDKSLKYTVLVSKDNYILDGTHRWIKHWQKDRQSQVPLLRLMLPVHEAIDLMRKFPKAQFVENSEDEARDEHGRWTKTSVQDYSGIKDTFKKIVSELPGRNFVRDTPKGDLTASINLSGKRNIELYLEKDSYVGYPVVHIDFEIEGEEVSSVKKGGVKEESLGMIRTLVRIVSKLHEAKIPVSATGADDRRKEFYAHLLEKLGMKHKEKAVWNTLWSFHTSSQKLSAFSRWIKRKVADLITGRTMREAWTKYVEYGWRRGAARAFEDVNQRKKWEVHPDTIGDLYTGGREQFLQSSFNHPESVEKVKLLASRTFTDLEGVTQVMSTHMGRVLTDGLTMGQHPRVIATHLARVVDRIGKHRALTVARTELIRAHAEGQLDNMERLGVQDVGVVVEWLTTGDSKVCPLCEPMQGIVLSTKRARGLIPHHPNCRCAWAPSFEPRSSPEEVETAMKEAELEPKVKSVFNTEDQPRDTLGRFAHVGAFKNFSEADSKRQSRVVMYLLDHGEGMKDVHHDIINLRYGKDYLKDKSKHDVVVLHSLYQEKMHGATPTIEDLLKSGKAPAATSDEHSPEAWGVRLTRSGARHIFVFSDQSHSLSGKHMGEVPGYAKKMVSWDMTVYSKKPKE